MIFGIKYGGICLDWALVLGRRADPTIALLELGREIRSGDLWSIRIFIRYSYSTRLDDYL